MTIMAISILKFCLSRGKVGSFRISTIHNLHRGHNANVFLFLLPRLDLESYIRTTSARKPSWF